MMFIRIFWLVLAASVLSGCGRSDAAPPAAGAAASDYERGPHNGRLLRDGDFALEVTLYETGVPPQFRLYAYHDDAPLSADAVRATIELGRLDGKVDRFSFTPQADVLVGNGTVVEPHSFDVNVSATTAEREHRWQYASYEGRTTIPAEVATAAGVEVAVAGPATIRKVARLMGAVTVDANRVARVRARYPGAVLAVHAGLGDRIERGQVLAVVEAHESMQSYSVTAPANGVITLRNTNVGDVAGDAPLFEITDLSEVWVDLHAFGRDLEHLAPGQPVTVSSAVGNETAQATLERILPVAVASTQSAIARVRLPNPTGLWRPGLAVTADVVLAEHAVPLAVQTAALQRFRDFTVVFARIGETYEVRMLELGRRDGDYVEVLGGIDAGTAYVSRQSFLIRADIEKSGASHDH